jgi:hypothetical protein
MTETIARIMDEHSVIVGAGPAGHYEAADGPS